MLQEFGEKLKIHSKTMDLFHNLDPKQCLIASFTIKRELLNQVELLKANTQLCNAVKITFKVNEIISQLQNIQTLGMITEEETPSIAMKDIIEIENRTRSLQLGLITISSPQVALASNSNLIAADVKLAKTLRNGDFNLGNLWLYSATFLQDGGLLTTQSNSQRLLMFDSNNEFRFMTEYHVKGNPYSTCISLNNETHVHVLCDKKTVATGIGLSGDTIITGEEKQVVLYNKEGLLLYCISTEQQDNNPICTSANGEKFYYTDGDSIVCRTLIGRTEEFKYSHPSLKYPIDLSCDRDGNILVVGLKSKNILQISADGKNGRILLDKFSSIDTPLAVCCHPHRDLFVVTSKGEDTVMEIYEFC